MTDKEFTFDYAWIDQVKLKHIREWEFYTNESWEEFNRYGGAPVYNRDGSPKKVDGEIVRRNNMDCTIAFIYILIKTQREDVTIEEIENLPVTVLNTLYRSLAQYLTKLVADAGPKSEDKAGNQTKKSNNDKA